NTLRHVCICIIPALGCGKMCFSDWFVGSRSARGVWGYCVMSNLSSGVVPLLPLYIRGAGLHEGVLVGYRIGVLVGYNCASCIQGRSDSIHMPLEASCSLA